MCMFHSVISVLMMVLFPLFFIRLTPLVILSFFFFQAEDGIRDLIVTGVQTCALPILLHKPGVTAPIVGATKLRHLEDALAAEQLTLSEEEIAHLEEPYVPHAVAGHG